MLRVGREEGRVKNEAEEEYEGRLRRRGSKGKAVVKWAVCFGVIELVHLLGDELNLN